MLSVNCYFEIVLNCFKVQHKENTCSRNIFALWHRKDRWNFLLNSKQLFVQDIMVIYRYQRYQKYYRYRRQNASSLLRKTRSLLSSKDVMSPMCAVSHPRTFLPKKQKVRINGEISLVTVVNCEKTVLVYCGMHSWMKGVIRKDFGKKDNYVHVEYTIECN